MPLFLLLVIICSSLTACDSTTAPNVGLNEEFTLAPGERVSVATTRTRVRFTGVSGDSRCPADAICIQGGDALVQIVAETSGATKPYVLHTGSMAPVQHNDLTITLVQLQPYPFSSGPITPGDYRATLRATR